jgi:bacillithiol biosynthesis deacetylase BshB1
MNDFDFDVVAFGAHPDDVELTCGGTIRKLAKIGYKIALVDLTQGELGSRGDVATRQAESKEAAKILGIQYRENLNLPDGALDGLASGEPQADTSQLSKVVSAIRRLKPQIILCNYGECRHPDHLACEQLVTRAVFFAALPKYKIKDENTAAFKTRQVLYYASRFEFSPSFIVDVTDVIAEKDAARKAYASQLGLDNKPGHKTLLSSPLLLDSLDARDRYYGAMIGVPYGEPFMCRAALKIEDPVALFSNYTPDSASIFPIKLVP